MSEKENSDIYIKVISNHYLSNCYKYLIRSKLLHFLLMLLEILLNTIQELDLIVRDFNPVNQNEKSSILSFILSFIKLINDKIPKIYKFLIMISFVILFDSLYLYIKNNNFIYKNNIHIIIIVNILELFYFRIIVLVFFNLVFSFNNLYLSVSIITLIPHVYLHVNNFYANHLYYFVPEFIDYPFDEFSFCFDIFLFVNKIFLALVGSSNNIYIAKFYFIILFIIQIFCFVYFINQLINHSYLFMKNTFLNKARICLYIYHILIIIYSMVNEQKQINNIAFIVVCVILVLVIIGYFFFIYNPLLLIKIKKETPMKNILFYLYSISSENKCSFLIKHKINEHYEKCRYCSLCKKYTYYLNKNKKNQEIDLEESRNLVNNEKIEINNNIQRELKDLFFIFDDVNVKYFSFMKNMVKNYNIFGKESFKNYTHYYINISLLMYENEKIDFNLLLNEKLILEFIHEQNSVLLSDNKPKVIQIYLCNKFMILSNNIINKLKDILSSTRKLNKAQEIINLSFMLKDMENKEYKNNLFINKREKTSNCNFKNLITICSIIYEEIFNKAISNSNIPIRDNIQILEEIFYNNNINKIISLSVNLVNGECNIIRVGKDLSSHINQNLFDLFPIIFKDYQITLFLSSIFDKFDNNLKSQAIIYDKSNSNNNNLKKLSSKFSLKKDIKIADNKKSNNSVEIKLIICENISSKIFYKCLTLKLSPLIINNHKYLILFDGVYTLHKKTFITEYQRNIIFEKLLFVSGPDLEKNYETYKIPLKKYQFWLETKGYNISKLFSFNISFKNYIIYELRKNGKEMHRNDSLKETKIYKKGNSNKQDSSNSEETKVEKIKLIEDNKSVASQMDSITNNNGISITNTKNKKKEEYHEYNKLKKISNIIHPLIMLISLLIIIEYFHLIWFKNKISQYNDAFIKFRKFSKYYSQIFSLTLSISCIFKDSTECRNILSYYSDKYFLQYPKESFNVTLLLLIHCQRIIGKMSEKNGYTHEINELLGNKKYNEIFDRTLHIYHLSQSISENSSEFYVIYVEQKFSESLLILCNSFNEINSKININNIIYFINKTEQPFYYHNQNLNRELNDLEKQIYDMILNYKAYSNELNFAIKSLSNLLIQVSSNFKIILYLYLNFNIILLLLIGFFCYFCINFFEKIIVKALNYINMTMNTQTDDFNFNECFSNKLNNLEIILHSYNTDIFKGINNLKKLYYNYQKIERNRKKNEKMKMNKDIYINYENKGNNENDKYKNIPKNHIIIEKNQICQLKITKKYYAIIYFIILTTLILYIILLILWTNYFNLERNLFILINKNIELESAVYNSINMYYLMIFNNFSLTEISQKIYPEFYNPKESLSVLKYFYSNIKSAFNSQKEKNYLGNLYQNRNISNFTCDNLYTINEKMLNELNATASASKLSNIKEKLISMCENFGINELKEPKNEFERHFQYLKNEIIYFRDSSYESIINQLKTGNLGKITLLFNNVMIYLLEIYTKIDKATINGLCDVMKIYILVLELSFISINILFFIIIRYYLIIKINIFIKQIISIMNVFKIIEMQE